jgi:dTDP-4-amino-4,6-dideoxygalactose transaminase
MEILEKHVNLRRDMHAFYLDLFRDIDGVTVFDEPNLNYHSNHWLSCITIDPAITGKTSEELRLSLEKENIETRPLWKPMHLQPVFEKCPYYGTNVAEGLFFNGLCLPSGSNLSESDKKRIADALQSFF